MSKYRLTRTALDDLEAITNYLAEQGGWGLSMRIEDKLFNLFEQLAASPGMGHRRSDLTPLPLVFFPVHPYIVVYQRDTSPIYIHAVLHGSRNLKHLLQSREPLI